MIRKMSLFTVNVKLNITLHFRQAKPFLFKDLKTHFSFKFLYFCQFGINPDVLNLAEYQIK